MLPKLFTQNGATANHALLGISRLPTSYHGEGYGNKQPGLQVDPAALQESRLGWRDGGVESGRKPLWTPLHTSA